MGRVLFKHVLKHLYQADLWEVYDGIWGFHGVLAMGGVSCVFYAFGPMSFILGLIDCVAVAVAHFALRANMTLQVRPISG